MTYRKNRIIEKLKADQLVTSLKINCTDSIPVEIAAMCGADCIWLDMEHCAADYNEIGKQILAAKAHGAEVIVRTPRGAYSNLTRPLELDASGVMVPHVMGYEDARQVVYYSKFHPIGRRPLDGGNADGKYCLIDPLTYMKEANEERFVVVQIEDPEPLAELEEICALDGIDMIFFGPADFSQGIGAPCQFGDPRIAETRRLVAETAKKYGKFAGTTGSAKVIAEYRDMGYDFVNVISDVTALAQMYTAELEASKAALSK